jgi:hypothetical protein
MKRKINYILVSIILVFFVFALLLIIQTPYNKLKEDMLSGNFSSVYIKNSEWKTKFENSQNDLFLCRTIRDALYELHNKDDFESTLYLLNNLGEVGMEINGLSGISASETYIEWLINKTKEEGAYICKYSDTRGITEKEIETYKVSGFMYELGIIENKSSLSEFRIIKERDCNEYTIRATKNYDIKVY